MSISAFHAPKVDTSVGPHSEIAAGELKKYNTLRVDEIISVGNKHDGKKAKYGLFSIWVCIQKSEASFSYEERLHTSRNFNFP